MKRLEGYVREIPKDVETTRTIPFVISSTERDAHRSVVNMKNWDLARYNRNPIVGYMHDVYGDVMMCATDNPDTVIGYSTIDFEGDLMIGRAVFETNDINPLAEKIFKKVRFGTLRGASVGFLEIGEGRYGDGEERRGGKEETYYFEGQELLEWSVVKIPSNAAAVKRFASDKITRFLEALSMQCGAPVQDLLRMSAQDIIDLSQGKSLIKEEELEEQLDPNNLFRKRLGLAISEIDHSF